MRKSMDLEKQLTEYIERNQDSLYDCLSKLIQRESQNFIQDGNERNCAELVRQMYLDLGLQTELYAPDDLPGFTEHADYLPGRNTANRPNVEGLWRGSDGAGGTAPAVMLAAHTDTMPVGDRAKWQIDPFGGIIQDNRIYGLGSGDNKAGLAAAYFAVKALQGNDVRLKKSVVLSAYCDEEYGGGNGTLATCLRNAYDTCVNLDGGNYELWTIALGGGGFRIQLHKTTATDSLMDMYLAINRLMEQLQRFAERRRAELHQIPVYRGSDMERSAFRLSRIEFAKHGFNEASVGFVIYTDKTKAVIEAELATILDEIRPFLQRYSIITDGFMPTTRFFPYLTTDKSNGAAEIMRRAAEETAGRPVPEKGSCLTDLNLFIKYGSPHSFNFGILRDFALPGGAHQPDEYVDCAEFLAYTKALTLFLVRYCGVSE